MALSAAASSAGRSVVTLMKQTVGAVSGRAFSSEAQPPKGKSSIVEPSYTYMPPGSSMREPLYFSTSDPVYFVDPKPDANAPPPPPSAAEAPSTPAKPDPSEPITLKKFDFSSISGKNGDDGRPVSARK